MFGLLDTSKSFCERVLCTWGRHILYSGFTPQPREMSLLPGGLHLTVTRRSEEAHRSEEGKDQQLNKTGPLSAQSYPRVTCDWAEDTLPGLRLPEDRKSGPLGFSGHSLFVLQLWFFLAVFPLYLPHAQVTGTQPEPPV